MSCSEVNLIVAIQQPHGSRARDLRAGGSMAGDDSISDDERQSFLRRLAAEVCLLLDHLSGRPDYSLSAQLMKPGGGADDSDLDKDLGNPSRLIERVAGIRYSRGSDTGEHALHPFAEDAAFLIQARDRLNSLVWPASGATIAFTTMTLHALRRPWLRVDKGLQPAQDQAFTAFPRFCRPARWFAWSIRATAFSAFILLVGALIVLAYAAWGKGLLDTMDAIRHDLAPIRLEAEKIEIRGDFARFVNTSPDTNTSDAKGVDTVPVSDYIASLCPGGPLRGSQVGLAGEDRTNPVALTTRPSDPTDLLATCDDLKDIHYREGRLSFHLQRWNKWPGVKMMDEQLAPIELSIVGNYILPILYALLGSMAFVLRRFHKRLAGSLLTPRDLYANLARIALGSVIGVCVGSFFTGSAAASQAQGVLALSVSLPAVPLAFLAGYGVEAAFRLLDGLLLLVFNVSELGLAHQRKWPRVSDPLLRNPNG
jgi:hypothetical protein